MPAVAAKPDPRAKRAYAGISMFAVEKNERGPTVSRPLKKLGYKGVDTCEVLFEDVEVPAANLIGGRGGEGLKQGISPVESGRPHLAGPAAVAGLAPVTHALPHSRPPT